MKRLFNSIAALLVLLGFAASLAAESEFSLDKAKRVDMMIKHIAQKKRKSPFLRKVSFNEDELNSYLNLIYTKRYSPEVKYVKLKLEKNSYVKARMKIILSGEKYAKAPAFLRDIDVETSGKVECSKYRMRFLFDDIVINGKSFSPAILDEAFGAVQMSNKVKKSMYDWFQLLPGIKDVLVDEKKLTMFY